jgi:hypothetical protein
MADEQIIYISPEEELTNVRERLERTAARRIILVIPPQTQLRSHVGWRLLHARTREMGKDVVINSSDRQIRAVAKAAGFRVADSLESPTTGKSRPPSRPGRNVSGGKAPSRPRGLFGRGQSENRPTAQRGATPRGYAPSNDRPLTQLSPQPPQMPQSEAGAKDVNTLRSAPLRPPTGMDSMISPGEEIASEGGSSTFGSRDNPYGQDFEYRIDTAPSIQPLSPPFEDEEPDLLIDDFKQAQDIRQAAQMGNAEAARIPPQEGAMGRAPTPGDLDDPLTYREDFQPSSLPEQHGSVPIDELDTDVPDIADVPTSIIVDGEIEDLGDEGDIVDPYASSPRTWSEPVMEEPEDAIDRTSTPDEGARFTAPSTEPPRVYGMRPRTGRSAMVPPPPYEDMEDEDSLLPPEQPIRPAAPSRGGVPPITVGNRPPQPIITPQSRTPSGASAARPTPAAAKQPPASTRPRIVRPPVTGRPAPRRRSARGVAFILTTIVVVLLVLGILLILIPSADITVTLPSQVFSAAKPLTVTATGTSREDTKLHTVPAQQLIFNKTVGPLSGTVQVGGQATGYVTFTNNGAQQLTIPTNTAVATKSGVEFLTQGQFVVAPASTFPAVPITAQNAGTIGNVAAGTITVIPPSSIAAIAQANNIPSSSVSLAVTNPTPTSRGTAGSSSTATNTAINAVKQQLHQQMQAQFTSWLKGQLHAQDVASRATPDLLGSRNPLTEETFSPCSPDTNGNFTCSDTLQATVLVVRTADLQTAARAEVNAALASSKQYAGYALIPQSSFTLSNIRSTTSKDGKTLMVSFTPKGLIGQNLSNSQLDNLRSLLAGRKVDDAKIFLTSGTSGLKGATNPQVTLFPGFVSNIPFWTARIQIHVQYRCTGKNCPKG